MPAVAAHEETMAVEAGGHRTVLLRETVGLLRPRRGAIVVDATLGAGGHAEALLDSIGSGGKLYGIDRDPAALAFAARRLARFGESFSAIRGDYRDLPELMRERGVDTIDGVVADLGVSSLQLDDPERGFALRLEGPLDMRMDPTAGTTAADLVATLPEAEIASILLRFGEERRAAAIARAIVDRRHARPLRTTRDLAELVERVQGAAARRYRIHPATRTFQALRIAVNRELAGLERFVSDAVGLLRPGGRVAVISFHSLEDRIVKRALRDLAAPCVCPPELPMCACGKVSLIRILTARPIRPTDDETRDNPRARSARLRGGERR
jgi:16S rRNA (cytosine1402-N4)-methyltransferase